jgi:hypothetical protein
MNRQGAIVKGLLFIFLSLGLSASRFAAAQAVYKRASVCEVLVGNQKRHLRYVAIDADLFVVPPDGMALFDKRCPQKGLGLDFPAHGADGSVSKLDKLIRSGELPMESSGLFRGKIIYRSKSKRPVLSLDSVLNLEPKIGPTTSPDVTNPIGPGKSLLPDSSHADPQKPQ